MFRRLSRRILLISILTIYLCTSAIGIFSYQWAKNTVRSELAEVSSNYYRNANELFLQHMSYLEETAKVILNNPIISHELWQPKVSTDLQPALDSLTSGLDLKLLGISIYKTDGTVYSLSRMSNLPSLAKLRSDPRFDRFIGDSSEKSAWMFRDRDLAFFYSRSYSANGALTYLLKAYGDSGNLLGILLIDLDADKIFDFFATNNPLFKQSELYLLLDGQRIGYASAAFDQSVPDAGNLSQIKKDPEGSFISANSSHLFLFKSVLNTGTKIVMDVRLNSTVSDLHPLKISLFLYTLLFSAIAVMLAYSLRTSIIRPLSQLYKRIKNFI